MSNFLTHFGAWMAVAAAAVVGIVAIYGLFDKRKGEVKKEENAVEDRLINLFKEEVAQLNKRIDEQDDVIEELEAKVDNLLKENDTLIKVLQGKDEVSQKFHADAYASMEKLNLLFDIVKLNSENIAKLVTLLDRRFNETK